MGLSREFASVEHAQKTSAYLTQEMVDTSSMVNISLSCTQCSKMFERNVSRYNSDVKHGKNRFFCSQSCLRDYRSIPAHVGVCKECNKNFTRKRKGTRDKLLYCSSSCATLNLNKTKEKTQYYCLTCNANLSGKARKYCKLHKAKQSDSSKTLQELRDTYSISQYHAKIRGLARITYKSTGKSMSCLNCGYDLHVDICHIKDVKDFEMEATLAEVNHTDNLIALDKRCHWEFDNGYLSLEQINAEVA